jgi:murein DD-endopeptidase MepM/ murein hydrolase activator NlpD
MTSPLDLGRDIGRPRWFLQFGLFAALVGGTVALGFANFHPPRALTTAGGSMTAPAAATPHFTQADFITVDGPPRRDEVALAPTPVETTVTVGRGDTLGTILADAGIAGSAAHDAVSALAKVYDPRQLQAGQNVSLTLTPDESALEALSIAADVDRAVVVKRSDDGSFSAEEVAIPLAESKVHAGDVIDNSLYLSAAKAGVPDAVILEMIRIYSYEVDFQRDIRSGDRFEVYYDQYADDSGNPVKYGNVAYASLTLSGKKIDLYRFKTADGDVGYFHADGTSMRRFLMKTPVDGARISDTFGMRKHPILGYTRMHKGIDFAVPTGTPIMAAGDGVIERASRWGSFGNYIRIRHNGTYKTAYAHLSRYAKGIKPGVHVKQGQVIGYVGMTGEATGPHLHYEILVHDKQVNPQSLKLPTGIILAGADMARFKKQLPALQEAIADTPMTTQVASSGQ